MQKKLTITIDEEVYEGLHKTIGPRKISRYIPRKLFTPMSYGQTLNRHMLQWQKTKSEKKKLLNGLKLRLWMWIMKRSEVWWVKLFHLPARQTGRIPVKPWWF